MSKFVLRTKGNTDPIYLTLVLPDIGPLWTSSSVAESHAQLNRRLPHFTAASSGWFAKDPLHQMIWLAKWDASAMRR